MLSTRTISWIAAVWVLVLGSYALAPFVLHDKQSLTSFADIAQCLVPLLANAGLLMNAGTPHWRRNVFWMLFAMGCTLWMIGQFQWRDWPRKKIIRRIKRLGRRNSQWPQSSRCPFLRSTL